MHVAIEFGKVVYEITGIGIYRFDGDILPRPISAYTPGLF
jgi:hypothetical protein